MAFCTTMAPTSDELDAAVRAVLAAPGAKDGELTARQVRTACEERLGLPKDGLVAQRGLSRVRAPPPPAPGACGVLALVPASPAASTGRTGQRHAPQQDQPATLP